MELDLVGQTVTQAIAKLRQALVEAEDQLTVKTDSETVKLNLYNHVHRLGLRCKAERKGSYHYLQVKVKGKPSAETTPVASGVRIQSREPISFPVGHLGASEPPKPAPKRKEAKQKEAQPKEAKGPFAANPPAAPVAAKAEATSQAPQPTPARTRRRRSLIEPLIEPPMDDSLNPVPSTARVRAAPTAPVPDRPRWLVIQNDQVGARDIALGIDLMEELLERLDARRFAGVFMVHRGVRLLDPSYADGRLLRALLRHNIKLMACARSVAFYQLGDRVTIQTAPFSEVLDLAAVYDLVWI